MKNGNLAPSTAGREAPPHGICYKPKTKGQKICLLIMSLIAVLAVVTGLFYWGFSVKIEVCTSPQCVGAAAALSRLVDAKVDPCDDFYRFSCGGFLRETRLDDRGSRSSDSFAEERIRSEIRSVLEQPTRQGEPKSLDTARRFYRACMDETAIDRVGLREMKDILKRIGGWPTLMGDDWREETFDWIKVMHQLRQMGANFNIFFLISVDRDRTNDSRYVLGIHGSECSPSGMSSEVQEMYLDYMADVARIFGAEPTLARTDSKEVLGLFLELAKITKEYDMSMKNDTDDYERLTLSELLYKYPDIQWYYLINGILNPTGQLDYDNEVVVVNPNHIKRMQLLLKTTPKRSLANYIAWYTITNLINYMPSPVLNRTYELMKDLFGSTMKYTEPRWKRCLTETQKRMSPVISATYIQTSFPEEIRQRVIDMIRNIKTQFESNLLRLEWMDKKTKVLILEKLHSSIEEIPSYADLLELLEENRIYDEVRINETQYLQSALNLHIVNFDKEFSKLRKEVKDEWLSDSSFITGSTIRYSPKRNTLTFPLGIFRELLHRPEYITYGGLAPTIAHEISHIFVMAHHENVELRSWWSPDSLVRYDEKLQCLSDQYSGFVIPELRGRKLHPEKTQDEDMADVAGMKIAYDTYTHWREQNGPEPLLPGLNYSANQLFWIYAATRHCTKYSGDYLERNIEQNQWSPEQLRVNGPLQNLNEFAFDFGCPIGSRMNPEKKCDIW